MIEELRSLALEGRSPEPGWRFDRDEIYAPRAERRRSRIAMAEVEAAIISREGVISTQVLQEYFCVTTRKLGTDPGIAHAAWTAMCG